MNRFDRLRFKQLSQFMAVADVGSISEAADNLFLPQPALSRSIKELEESLGVKLFERNRKGVTLTNNGKQFLSFASLVQSNFATLEADLVEDEQHIGGLVRIGTGAYEGYTFLPEVIGKVLSRRPKVQFSFSSGKFNDLIGPLLHGKLDLIFGPVNNGSLPKGTQSHIVAQSTPLVLVRPEHPLADKGRVTLSDLASQEWLVPVTNTLPRRDFDQVFLKAKLQPPTGPVEISPSVLMLAILRQRNLLGLVPPKMATMAAVGEELVELTMDDNPFRWPLQLTTIDRRHPSRAVDETIALIKAISQ